MKLEIPKFRYLAQDKYGHVKSYTKPTILCKDEFWLETYPIYCVIKGAPNPNWRDTRINLEVDDYEFEDGILRRVEK